MGHVARLLLATLAAGLLLAACGDDKVPLVEVSDAVEADVRAVFSDYADAMREGDYARACTHLTPEAVERMRTDATRIRPDLPAACGDVLKLVTGSASAKERDALDQLIRTAKIDGVYEPSPPRSDAVIIAWTARVNGKDVPVQQPARQVDGDWRLVGASGS